MKKNAARALDNRDFRTVIHKGSPWRGKSPALGLGTTSQPTGSYHVAAKPPHDNYRADSVADRPPPSHTGAKLPNTTIVSGEIPGKLGLESMPRDHIPDLNRAEVSPPGRRNLTTGV